VDVVNRPVNRQVTRVKCFRVATIPRITIYSPFWREAYQETWNCISQVICLTRLEIMVGRTALSAALMHPTRGVVLCLSAVDWQVAACGCGNQRMSPSPRSGEMFREIVLTVRSKHLNPQGWETTPCRLSATADIYSHLPSICNLWICSGGETERDHLEDLDVGGTISFTLSYQVENVLVARPSEKDDEQWWLCDLKCFR
jgi:hypothetical protein